MRRGRVEPVRDGIVLGWLLVGVVIALAAVNLFLGFCLGCFMYYQLARRGIQADLPWWRVAQGA